MAKGNQGIRSKNVTRPSVRTGTPRNRVHVPRAAELGEHVGNHTLRGNTHYRGERPLIRGPGYPSVPLGNEVALNVKGVKNGAGAGRTLYGKSGSQGVQGPVNPGNATPKGELFPGWPAKR